MSNERACLIFTNRVVFAPVEYTLAYADRDKIGQVLNNLINNAVKYSPAGSTIHVACATKNKCAEVCVKDRGMGIRLEDQQHHFERYYRVEAEHMKSTSGFSRARFASTYRPVDRQRFPASDLLFCIACFLRLPSCHDKMKGTVHLHIFSTNWQRASIEA